MYVRWKKREMTRALRYSGRRDIGAFALTAVLVECRRVGGRPRQRFVAHLGTVRVWKNGLGEVAVAGGGSAFTSDVRSFWTDVARKLNAVNESYDRAAIEASIDAVVTARGPSLGGRLFGLDQQSEVARFERDRGVGAEDSQDAVAVLQPEASGVRLADDAHCVERLTGGA